MAEEGGAAGTIGEAFVEIRPELNRFFSEISGGLKSAAEGAVNANSGAMSKLASVGEVAVASLAAGFAVVAVASIHAADTFEIAHAQLENAIKNTGGNFEELQGRLKNLEREFENYGYTNAQTETALTKLTQATHDPKLAMDDLGVAANIAAGRHMDLGAASQLLSRVLQGNYGVLVRLGVATRDQVKDIHSQQQAIDLLNKTYGGSAAAAADTFAGKQAALKARIEDLEKSIGLALIPVLEDLATAAGDTIDFFEKNRAAAITLGIVIGGPLSAAIAAFIIQEGILIGTKIVEFFESVIEYSARAALAIAAAADGIYAALGPIGLLLAAAGTLAVVFGRASDEAAKTGRAFADAFVTEANRSSDSTAILKQRISDLASEQQNLIIEETKHLDASGKVNLSLIDQARSFLNSGAAGKALESQYQHNRAEISRYQGELKKHDDAQKSSADAMKAAKEAGIPLAEQQDTLAVSAQELADKTGIAANTVQLLANKLKVDLTKATQEQIDSLTAQADRLHDTSAASLDVRDAMEKLGSATEDAKSKADAFKVALDGLFGFISADRALDSLRDKYDALTEKLKTNGVQFDVNTAKGRENREALFDSIQGINDHIEALKRQGKSSDDLKAAVQGDIDKFKEQLTAAGLSKTAIEDLANSYGLIPSNFDSIINADTTGAVKSIDVLYQKMSDLRNLVEAPLAVTISPDPHGSATGPVQRRFAGGGYTGEGGGVVDPHELVLPLDNPAAMRRAFAQVPSRYRSQFAGDGHAAAAPLIGQLVLQIDASGHSNPRDAGTRAGEAAAAALLARLGGHLKRGAGRAVLPSGAR